MKSVRDIMGMPVSIEISDTSSFAESLEKTFEYFDNVDRTFSTYKKESEICRINRGEADPRAYSKDMQTILSLAEETRQRTDGYFDVRTPQGELDPSGLVKGWAINNAAEFLRSLGHKNIYVEIAGDIQTYGKNADGKEWRIGIRNPFKREEIVKVIYPRGHGVATSGTAARGEHIYSPHTKRAVETNMVSITVIGPNVYEADRFATAAFAMGERGLAFIENLPGFEAYAIAKDGIATMTSGFETYTYDQAD